MISNIWPSSTNGTIYNDKKIKQLAEPIEIRALEEMESLSMGKYLLFVSAQDACRAKRTLERILIVVYRSVSTRGPVLADRCELCGSKEKVEVHHIRKLADLKQPGRKEKPEWVKQMIARRRKTLVVCRNCHEAIHAGTSTASFRRKGTGEPREAKVSREVREGGNKKGP